MTMVNEKAGVLIAQFKKQDMDKTDPTYYSAIQEAVEHNRAVALPVNEFVLVSTKSYKGETLALLQEKTPDNNFNVTQVLFNDSTGEILDQVYTLNRQEATRSEFGAATKRKAVIA